MKPFVLRLSLFGLLFCVGVFFGIDIATKGMEQVYGPADSTDSAQQNLPEEKASAKQEQKAPSNPGYVEPVVYTETDAQLQTQAQNYNTANAGKISKVAGGLSSLLQSAAQGVVDLIVAFFDKLLV